MVGFHFLDLKMLATHRADAPLPLISRAFLAGCKAPQAERAVAAGEHIGVDAAFVGDVIVHHQFADLALERPCVEELILKLVIQGSPADALHFPAVFGEGCLHPFDHVAEVGPQFVGVGVVLVFGHIVFDLVVRDPFQGGFENFLPDGGAIDIIFRQQVSRRVGFAENRFGMREPGSGVGGVAQLLLGQFDALHVDDAEPCQAFVVAALADVDHQLVVQNLVFGRLSQVVEGEMVNREVTLDILAKADRALLPVHDFEGAVFVFHPIHDVEREALANAVDDGVAFIGVIDEFALIFGADVEPEVIAEHALFVVVDVVFGDIADGDFLQVDFHFAASLRLINIRLKIFFPLMKIALARE